MQTNVAAIAMIDESKESDDSIEKSSENIVDRAVEACGGSLTILAERLERVTGEKCTKQMIWNWKDRGQIPADWVLAVYRVTRIPMNDLLVRTRKRSSKAP